MRVFIIGGTSGIGLALAKKYLSIGAEVGICGRDISKVVAEIGLRAYQINVCHSERLLEAVETFVGNETLDILVNCAGSYAEDVIDNIAYDTAIEMLHTNMIGTINTLEVGRGVMARKKGQGKIALIASVSGILDYPQSSLYTKTKRSSIYIAEAYRRALEPLGIRVITIAPGYVDTQKLRLLNHNDLSKKPFVVSEKQAVEEIYNAIERGDTLHIFPKKMKYLMIFLSKLPQFILSRLMYKKAKWMTKD